MESQTDFTKLDEVGSEDFSAPFFLTLPASYSYVRQNSSEYALDSIKKLLNHVDDWVDGILSFLGNGLDSIVGHFMDRWDRFPIRVWKFIG